MKTNKSLRFILPIASIFLMLTSMTCNEYDDLYIYNGSDETIWVERYYLASFPADSIQVDHVYLTECAPGRFTTFGSVTYWDDYELSKNFISASVIADSVYRKYTMEEIIKGHMFECTRLNGIELKKRQFLLSYPFEKKDHRE